MAGLIPVRIQNNTFVGCASLLACLRGLVPNACWKYSFESNLELERFEKLWLVEVRSGARDGEGSQVSSILSLSMNGVGIGQA